MPISIARRRAPVPPGDARDLRMTTPQISASLAPAPSLRGLALLPGIVAAVGVALYPIAPLWLALGLSLYAVALWRWPQLWLVAVPALLPTLDLAPWSGRFFFDESDFLVLVTASVVYCRQSPRLGDWWLRGGAGVLVVLLGVAHLIAVTRGLMPLQPLGDNAFNNHFSAYNALRVGKGLAWALLLLPALSLSCRRDLTEAVRLLGLGFLVALGVVVLVSLRERQVFTGLFEFDLPFRVTATFASMNLGGGSLGAFMVMTLPMLALPFVLRSAPWQRLGAAVLLVPAVYTLIVTFNRAAYAGGITAFAILLLVLPMAVARRRRARIALAVGLASLAAVAAATLGVALPGSFAAERFDRIGRDLDIRLWEWRAGLALAEPGLGTTLFGTGLGSYPRTFLARNPAGRVPTTFAVAHEAGRIFLRLGSGESLYFGQRVAVRPDSSYRLSVSLRARSEDAQLVLPICEKTLLYSFRCEFVTVAPREPGAWEDHTISVRPIEIGRPSGLMGFLTGRPVELALYNPVPDTTIDIDDVSLVAETGPAAGTELLTNGGFEAGTDRWFYEADNLAIWRIENMWLMTLFEQGWLGLVALALVVAAALLALLRRIAGGLPAEAGAAAVLLSSIAGFLVVGCAHGLLDAPRLTVLFYLLLFTALRVGRPPALPRPAPRGAGWSRRDAPPPQPAPDRPQTRAEAPSPPPEPPG